MPEDFLPGFRVDGAPLGLWLVTGNHNYNQLRGRCCGVLFAFLLLPRRQDWQATGSCGCLAVFLRLESSMRAVSPDFLRIYGAEERLPQDLLLLVFHRHQLGRSRRK